jgi:trigger factor
MKVSISEKSPIERELEVSVESTRVQQSWDKHLRDLVRNVNIPGFRRGKAPRALVERYANREQLQRTVFEEVGVPAYREAVQQEKLAPLADPQVELVQFEPGKDLIFKATIEIRPEVEIDPSEYTDLEVEVKQLAVTDENVADVLEDMRKKATRTVSVDEDRGLQTDDLAVADFEASHEGEPVPNGSGENFQFLVNQELFVPGFATHLEGQKVDETREFDVDFPEDYGNKALAGKNVHFKFTLKGIKKREMPELDDDFAKEASRFATLDELKADIRQQLERNWRLDLGNRAVFTLAEKRTDIPVPRAFSNNVIMHTLESQARQFAQIGIKLEDYLRNQGIDINSMVEGMRPRAESSARAEMVLDAVVRKEEIKVDDPELDAEIKRFAEAQNRDLAEVLDEIKKHNHTESFRADVTRQRALEFLAGKVKPVPEKEKPEETETASLEAQPEGATEGDAGSAPAEEAEAQG